MWVACCFTKYLCNLLNKKYNIVFTFMILKVKSSTNPFITSHIEEINMKLKGKWRRNWLLVFIPLQTFLERQSIFFLFPFVISRIIHRINQVIKPPMGKKSRVLCIVSFSCSENYYTQFIQCDILFPFRCLFRSKWVRVTSRIPLRRSFSIQQNF